MIIGTAGHIDHGKTTLVKALTGVDTDRLKEEKARGITIELGFAYLPRPDGRSFGFVDVPGHERLVHTMLAGATGIDCALLVVAADDGVMPQTREHLAIIDLLGLSAGLIVMTKCDLADAARHSEVAAQIRAAVAGTGLAAAPILPVSAAAGDGLAALIAALDTTSSTLARRSADGCFRLAIDRVFSLAGAGTIATGTVMSGKVAVGDQVTISPAGLAARVRSIHAQNRASEHGSAGQRCALALVGPDISTDRVRRGAMLLAPELHQPVQRVDARFTLLTSERKPLSQWMPVRLHHGSAEVTAHVVPLTDEAFAPGLTGFVQLVLDEPIACSVGDRFVLRDTSATRTIGGGVLLDLRPPERRRRSPSRRADLTALSATDPLVALAGVLSGERGFADLGAFFRDRSLPASRAGRVTSDLGLVRLQGSATEAAMLPSTWAAFTDGVLIALTEHHRQHPDLPGLPQERLRLAAKPRLPAPLFSAALALLAAQGHIKLDRSWARMPSHEVRFSNEEERIWQHLRPLLAGDGRFRPPRVRDIATSHKIDEKRVRRLFKLAARRGDLDELAPDHFFVASTVIEMADIVRDLARTSAGSEFTVAAFRDRLDNGRKVAVQILEFFDRQGLTMRRGDIRRLNPHKADLYCDPAKGRF